jgi:uncharacterized membrane protein YidH (DUF202 family)
MTKDKFKKLIKKSIITEKELDEVIEESKSSGEYVENLLMHKGIPKHELLFCLSEYYSCPFVEYDESLMVSYFVTRCLDMQKHKNALWFPISIKENRAEVVAYHPDDPLLVEGIKKTLKVDRIEFKVAIPSDIIRIIENNFDVNPNFPPSGGRTPLAMVRTFLALRRSLLTYYRTSFAKGRTGLAFIRTGISFITIALVLFRIFGLGYLTLLDVILLVIGVIMTVDGFLWYIPARKRGKKLFNCASTEPTWGTTVLEVSNPENTPIFRRTSPVKGADKLRKEWNYLSPVMRRRFLASDRTDFAEERTTLACYRTMMARARTGLAFTRTGISFVGIGIALLRQFYTGAWTVFDVLLILIGIAMVAEGFYWYIPGRRAGREGYESIKKTERGHSIWDFVFPPNHKYPVLRNIYSELPVKPSHSPGIWATTGLALERTLLADRRGVMARLRSVMARSRTGMAFIRTGMRVSGVGMALLVYFGIGNIAWTIFNAVLVILGLVLIADGLYWHIPAEKIRKQFPYCFGDMDIILPDYGKPACYWRKVVFSHDET